ncbi:MAG: TonB-dependent receptor, partial [Cyclobacteriaceae bacterium]|nr:TonB-dependent receptor [Cyclobacteriaceae bacterium]
RTDMNTFIDEGNNPLNTLSPRISFSYSLNQKLNWNTSFGRYFKTPTYTVLGYLDETGALANKSTKYIRSDHYVTGFQFLPKEELKFVLEGFYKRYANYPVSVRDGISLANLGGDFNALGNELVISNGDGQTYGFEFSFQQKLVKKTFAVLSYTFVRSKFSGADGQLIASSWDNRHLLSGLLGRKFKKNWEVGVKYRFAGGAPFTPFDMPASQLNYATLGTGILDYTKLNTERLINFSQIDFRLDKKFNFKRTTLDLFIDVQNLLRFPSPDLPEYTFKRNADNTDFLTTDGQPLKTDGSNAIPLILQDESPFFVPTIGFIFEF